MNCQNTPFEWIRGRIPLITLAFVFILSPVLSSQETGGLRSIAGDGTPGFSDADPMRFNKPIRLAPYGDNAILVADIYNHAIRIVTLGGKVRTIAGGPEKKGHHDGPADEARFNSPHGVAFDKTSGEIIVAEAGNHTIRRFTPTSRAGDLFRTDYTVSTLAGTPGKEGFNDGPVNEALFKSPHAVVCHPDGGIIVADIGNARIRLIRDGAVSSVAGTGESGQQDGEPLKATFKYLMDLVMAGDRSILIADAGTNRVRKLVIGEAVTTVQLKAELHTPHGIAIDDKGPVFIADMDSHRILSIDNDGEVTPVCGTGKQGSLAHELNRPAAVLVHDGHLWIADLNNHQIKVIPL
jgi:DNA-binding beta-propeller fold protein YncE